MATVYTGNKVFAPAIFFLAFREALECSLVIGILLSMLERIVHVNKEDDSEDAKRESRKLLKKLRKYIFLGAATGLCIAFAIGAAFLAVFYTQTNDLFGQSEELWEGVFSLVAVCLITPMSLAILRADRSRSKWRKKLAKAFAGIHTSKDGIKALAHGHSQASADSNETSTADKDAVANTNEIKQTNSGSEHEASSKGGEGSTPTQENPAHVLASSEPKTVRSHGATGVLSTIWTVITRPFTGEAKGATAIFMIPLITTMREGLEGVVFIGGVSLGLPATSIPLPAIVGIFAGLLVGFIVFKAGSFSQVRMILVISTAVLLIIAAGMFSRSVYYFQFHKYVQRVGQAAAESGAGPGSYDALNYVWHINCCNPEDKTNNGGSGWAILNSLVGWNNTATVGSLLGYIFYWLAIASYLIYSMIQEKRSRKQQSRATV